MKWEKIGRVFAPGRQRPWIVSHASVPTPEHVRDNVFRIYFSPRDEGNRSHVSHIVIDLDEPERLLEIGDVPDLSPGAIGAFDDSGVTVSWLVQHQGRRVLYYSGWNLSALVPWRTAIGLAYGDAAPAVPVFRRHSEGPILDRSSDDPYFVSNPCVIVENGRWEMWYLSGLPWCPASPRPLPRYHVCHAESRDGIGWKPTGRACVVHAHDGEVAISRPCVLHEEGVYKMWYSYRGDTFDYRIGYAESPDGLAWRRLDHLAGLACSATGWDSEATAYPTVFDHDGRRYMLYCGNGYSSAGFGLAVLIDP